MGELMVFRDSAAVQVIEVGCDKFVQSQSCNSVSPNIDGIVEEKRVFILWESYVALNNCHYTYVRSGTLEKCFEFNGIFYAGDRRRVYLAIGRPPFAICKSVNL